MTRAEQTEERLASAAVVQLTPVIRRVVASRVQDNHTVDDIVQETLARVLASQERLEAGALLPYAVVTARNLVISLWEKEDRTRRHRHRLVDLSVVPRPDDEVVRQEESRAVGDALLQLSEREREALVGHEVEGADTASLARQFGSTPGAVAAQLSRARARLRVEYLLALEKVDPPTPRCRPVLLALSAGDRRRQRELDARGHLLACDSCAELSTHLLDRRTASPVDEARIPVDHDSDIVVARQKGRELAAKLGFSPTELTLIATAISEITRNIVRFARRGEVVMALVEDNGRQGIAIVARDAGPGIADVELATRDGYSTYGGLGLGLPGCRRLMDEFGVASEVDKGTTVTMTKWCPEPSTYTAPRRAHDGRAGNDDDAG